MEELLNRLQAKGLTPQQAMDAISVIKDFAKEKLPLFSGAIDSMFDKYSSKEEDDFMP
jgi:hypothetical protein